MASRQIRTLILCLIAVFAFSAVAASTASANRVWTTIGGNILPVGQTRSLKVVKNSPAELVGFETIVCNKVAINAGNTIENVEVEGKGPTGRDNGTITFSECKNKATPACVITEPITVPSPTSLVENTAGTKIYDLFRPEGRTELTPKKISEFPGTEAEKQAKAKKEEEKLTKYVNITQSAPCTVTKIALEGNGFAAELSPETEVVKHKLVFPCPTPISPVNLWNGVKEVGLRLKLFGGATKECINEVEVELTTEEDFGVK